MHVTGFTGTVSVNWSVSVSIFRFGCQFQFSFFRLLDYCYRFQAMVTLAYLSLSYAPWSEGGCLSSAKLRSTDSVNPRAVLSRVRPRYRLYSKHRDRRCWTGPGIGIRVSFRTLEGTQLFRTAKEQESAVGSRPPHLNVALSKAALSGPSVCLRARAPCPLRVTCLRIVLPDRGVQQGLQACVPVAPWDKTGYEPCAELTHGPATCAPGACLCKK